VLVREAVLECGVEAPGAAVRPGGTWAYALLS